MSARQFFIDGIRLVQTSEAHPEQYDAYDKDKRIAHLRVRWSFFSVRLFDLEGKLGAQAYGVPINGYGCFDPAEREFELQKAVHHIKLKLESLVTENEDQGVRVLPS